MSAIWYVSTHDVRCDVTADSREIYRTTVLRYFYKQKSLERVETGDGGAGTRPRTERGCPMKIHEGSPL